MTNIHPSAVVESGATLGQGVEIGPFCFVGAKAKIGAGVKLLSHVVVEGDTEIGPRTIVHAHAVLGGPAQFRAGGAPDAKLIIGADNVIREHVTMNGGTTKGGGVTRVDDNGYFMAYSHVAHDCHVGSGVTLANAVQLAGHVSVADGANLGGLAAVLQHVRIGQGAFITGLSGIAADVIPYGIVRGSRGFLRGLNLIGLKRRGLSRTQIHEMRAAYRLIFEGDGPFADRVEAARTRWPDSREIQEIVSFILADSKTPLCVPKAAGKSDEDD